MKRLLKALIKDMKKDDINHISISKEYEDNLKYLNKVCAGR